jgi:hypothetical protein
MWNVTEIDPSIKRKGQCDQNNGDRQVGRSGHVTREKVSEELDKQRRPIGEHWLLPQ